MYFQADTTNDPALSRLAMVGRDALLWLTVRLVGEKIEGLHGVEWKNRGSTHGWNPHGY